MVCYSDLIHSTQTNPPGPPHSAEDTVVLHRERAEEPQCGQLQRQLLQLVAIQDELRNADKAVDVWAKGGELVSTQVNPQIQRQVLVEEQTRQILGMNCLVIP